MNGRSLPPPRSSIAFSILASILATMSYPSKYSKNSKRTGSSQETRRGHELQWQGHKQGLRRGHNLTAGGSHANGSGIQSQGPPHVPTLRGTQANHTSNDPSLSNAHPTSTNDLQTFTNFSEAFAAGYSIPTSKFNTDAFGTLDIGPTATHTATNATSTHRITHAVTATAVDLPTLDEIESLSDDFELPAGFDDDIDMKTELIPEGALTLQIEGGGFHTDSQVNSQQTRPQTLDNNSLTDSQLVEELKRQKEQLDELQARLKEKETLLLEKSGEASIVKSKLESVTQTNTRLTEQLKYSELQFKTDRASLEEKHRKELANANMIHQFEVSKYIMDSTPSLNATKVSQPPRQQTPQPQQFPKSFSGFSATQTSSRPPARNDDGFSLLNFGVSSKSPKKSRSVLYNHSTLEKPRPLNLTGEASKPIRSTSGPTFAIPDQSPEEIMRDKLLAGPAHEFGLKRLMDLKSDEDSEDPLPESVKWKQNKILDEVRQACIRSLVNLTVSITRESKQTALKTASNLLKQSIIMQKPQHTVNALKAIKILYKSFKDIAELIRHGQIPLSISIHERQPDMILTEEMLPSPLACIHYLFVVKIAWPLGEKSLPELARPPLPDTISILNSDSVGIVRQPSLSLTLKAKNAGASNAIEQMKGDIYELMESVIRDQPKTGQVKWLYPMISFQVFEKVLSSLYSKSDFETLDWTLRVLEAAIKDKLCCSLLCGWSAGREQWTEKIEQVETLGMILDAKAAHADDMVNGTLPCLKMKVIDVLSKAISTDAEQSAKIIAGTKLMKRVFECVRVQVDIAETLAYTKSVAMARRGCQATSSFNAGDTSIGNGGLLGMLNESNIPSSSQHPQRHQQQSTVHGRSFRSSIHVSLPSTSSFLNEELLHKPSLLDPWLRYPCTSSSRSKNTAAVSPSGALPQYATSTVPWDPSLLTYPASQTRAHDFVGLLNRLLYFVLDIFKVWNEYPVNLKQSNQSDYCQLVFSVSAIVAKDLELPQQSKELAQDILGWIVPEAEEAKFLEAMMT
ncbi:hypothetical protein BGW38_007059 [Lunasporangiospora selenospora]|uniref:Uncharacterized protein n=1 Tax=Lunasporangiospora selenospora TaxID=979761 RepID=A0A9P6G2I7_9FUNG|nr:hypothetical protein BGW38_007059 [Lunasporangiospora selenospora]